MMIIGIVGKPNCGKSTFFKALTLAEVEIANYPFATIKPNHGVGFVKVDCPDKFFKVSCNPREGYCHNNKRFVPVDIIDVAGLVPGAHEGKGMGNQFLSDLNQADVLIHVIDISGGTNEKGEPVSKGSYNPANDITFLEEELDHWYLGILKKGWEKFARQVQQTHSDISKALTKQLSGLGVSEEICKVTLKKLNLLELPATDWTEKELLKLATEFRKATKPMVIAANKIDVSKENFEKLKKEFPELTIIPCSAESELALKEAAKHNLIEYLPGSSDFKLLNKMNEQQENALNFIKNNVLEKTTGVQEVINTSVFNILRYKAIFPGGVNNLADSDGNVLPDCFLMSPKSTALDFAFRIHTDIGNSYVKAIDVKKKLPISKDHILESGDVIEIMTS
jgi:hypothetical protein